MSGSLTGISATATVLAGTTGFASGGTYFPNGLALGPENGQLYFVSSNFDGTTGTRGLYKLNLTSGAVQTVATSTNVQNPIGLAIDQSASLAFFVDDYRWIGNGPGTDGLDVVNLAFGTPSVQTMKLGSAASLFSASAGWLSGVAVDPVSKMLYFTAASRAGRPVSGFTARPTASQARRFRSVPSIRFTPTRPRSILMTSRSIPRAACSMCRHFIRLPAGPGQWACMKAACATKRRSLP